MLFRSEDFEVKKTQKSLSDIFSENEEKNFEEEYDDEDGERVQAKEGTGEDAVDDVILDPNTNEFIPPEIPSNEILNNKNNISFKEVNNVNIKKVTKGRKPTDDLKITIIRQRNNTRNGFNIKIIAIAPDLEGRYYEVAVLTSEELNGRFSYLRESKAKTVNFVPGKKLNEFITNPSEQIMAELSSKFISKANYVYF